MKEVKENECLSIDRLYKELDRLKVRFKRHKAALEALDAVQFWATEERVPFADNSYFVMHRVSGEVLPNA